MNTPSSTAIPVDEVFVSDDAERALRTAGVSADEIAAQFSAGMWNHYGPSTADVRRAIQQRQTLEAAFILPAAGEILLTTWADGFLSIELEGEDDEDDD